MQLGTWSGKRQYLDQEYIDTLKFEDYLLADFIKAGENQPVNVYLAY
jgi:hypothetical protein